MIVVRQLKSTGKVRSLDGRAMTKQSGIKYGCLAAVEDFQQTPSTSTASLALSSHLLRDADLLWPRRRRFGEGYLIVSHNRLQRAKIAPHRSPSRTNSTISSQ